MVGIFSRFSSSRASHRRSKSSLEGSQVLEPNAEVTGSALFANSHGIEVAVEFKPIERPVEPLNNDQPIKCPLPEPSILNDGSIWKQQRISATAPAQRRADFPVMKEGAQPESKAVTAKPRSRPANRLIIPSISAPEHNILKLLQECNEAATD